MALIPRTMRPSFIIRRNARRKGIFGTSVLWKTVAVAVFGRDALKKAMGKQPDSLGTRTIGVGHVITVATSVPLTRRQAKQAGITKESLRADAVAELEAAQQAS